MIQNQNNSLMNKVKDKIAIDSNVFRNFGFINYLRQNKGSFQVFIPTIVYLEVGYYYLSKGITWEEFIKEIQKFDGDFLGWESIIVSEVLKNAISNKLTLPFREHFRDFLIGTQCENLKIKFITYNKNHFKWIESISILTPEEFVQEIENNY